MEAIRKDSFSTSLSSHASSLPSTNPSRTDIISTKQTSPLASVLQYHHKITHSEFITSPGPSALQLKPSLGLLGSQSTLQDCKICLMDMSEDLFQLTSCSHLFHKECVRMHILVAMEQAHFPILCPQKGCGCQILISDLQQLLSQEEIDKFYHFSFKHYVATTSDRLFGCPTPGCQNYVFRARFDFDRKFCCGSCLKQYCTECGLPWHLFMTCEEAKVESSYGKQDKEFEDLSKLKGFKRCPKCRTMLHLYTGCDFMECRCGHNFCFTCLKTHKEHTHEEYLMAQRRLKEKQKLEELLKGAKTDQGIRVIDEHTKWIYAQRAKNEMKLKELQKQKAIPVPKYPPPPKAYLESLKKIEAKKHLLKKAVSRHLLPAKAGVKTNI